MARKLKPYKVDEVYADGRGKVEMFLDRENKMFFGMVGPTRIEAQTAKDCRTKLHRALKDFDGLVWRRYIQVNGSNWDGSSNCNGHDEKTARVTVGFHRFEGAKTLDGSWVHRPFADDVHPDSPWGPHGKTQGWYILHDGQVDDPTTVEEGLILYSDEVWTTLNRLKDALDSIGTKIEQMIEGPDLNQMLLAGMPRLLAPPEDSK